MGNVSKLQPSPKHPPHSMEAEQSVLGGLLLNNRAWHDLADQLTEEDFYTHDHRVIWHAIGELMGLSKPVDFVTLSEHLRQQNRLDDAGGVAYLGTLASDTPSAANIVAYAEIVRERSVLRSLIATSQDIAELGYQPGGRTSPVLIDAAEQAVFAIRQRGEKAQGKYIGMDDLVWRVQQRLSDLRDDPAAFSGLPTGFVDLDKLTNGMHPGDLIIIAGRPGMGKTSFALGIGEYLAVERRMPVGVFSMEMSAEQLGLRMMSSWARVDLQHLRSGQLEDYEWARLLSAGESLRLSPIYIDETGSLSPLDLRARARRMAARHGLKLIIVDYIQLMQVPSTKENRTNEISEISRNLKALGKELGVPVIAISQLSRAVESRDNRRPRMSDLRESGGIEQDADVIAFVYRDEYYNKETVDRGIAEIIIAKQRSGPTGTVKTAFLGQYTRFENLAPEYAYT